MRDDHIGPLTLAQVLSDIEAATGRAPRRVSDGNYECLCPAHSDRDPSLHVAEGDRGIMLHCKAGCSFGDIVGALGYLPEQLFRDYGASADESSAESVAAVAVSPCRRVAARCSYRTKEAAIAGYRRGEPSSRFPYRWEKNGEPLFEQLRWDAKGDQPKVLSPVSLNGVGWIHKAPDGLRPLYRLPEIWEEPEIWFTEGEKACEAVVSVGLPAVTAYSNCYSKTDLSCLSGKIINFLPDNDSAGSGNAQRLLEELSRQAPDAVLRIVTLPGLADKDDAFDFVKDRRDRGTSGEEIREEIIRISEETEPSLGILPFPADALGDVLGDYVRDQANSIGCAPEAVALPVLSVIAAATGSSRAIEVHQERKEPCVWWSLVVGPSGSKKTPAVEAAIRPLRRKQREVDAHRGEQVAAGEVPEEQILLMTDTTTEALAEKLQWNPKGVLCHYDEFEGFMGSFGAYKSGKGGGGLDRAFWNGVYDANYHRVERKGKGAVVVDSPHASIVGGIQTAMLAESMSRQAADSGLIQRFGFALLHELKPIRNKRREPRGFVSEMYGDLIDRLHGLEDKAVLTLSPEAGEFFEEAEYRWEVKAFHLPADSGLEKSLCRKSPKRLLRLAILIHVATRDPSEHVITRETFEAAERVNRWLYASSRQVFALLPARGNGRASTPQRIEEAIVDYVTKSGSCAARDLKRGPSRLRELSTEQIRELCDRLVTAGRLARCEDMYSLP